MATLYRVSPIILNEHSRANRGHSRPLDAR